MTRRAAKVTVLDVDGTLIPGSLGLELARYVAAQGAAVELAELEHILASYRRGDVSYEPMNARAHQIFAHGLAGLHVDEVRAAAAEVWESVSAHIFDYARPLITRLSEAGFDVLLISGSPAEVVRLAAADLGAAGWHGASLETADGRYLPRIRSAPGLPGGKLRALGTLGALTGAGDEAFPVALAVGNSPSDVELLERAARPYAFEPDRALKQLAQSRGWPIVDRDNALERISSPEPA